MDIDFGCTICGQCCRDLRLPLTVAEAIAWLEDGHEVQVLCDAIPWPQEPAADDGPAQHKRRRSFTAMSGELPIRVTAILVAPFDGPCPNLQADQYCRAYARRPLVCRIYPAEINPFISLQPTGKNCPPEAWSPHQPPLLRGGRLVDTQLQQLIEQSRRTDVADVTTKQRLCALLGLSTAALANEGLVVHAPGRADLLGALRQAAQEQSADATPSDWCLISNRRPTREALADVGACWGTIEAGQQEIPGNDAGRSFRYLGFHPDSP